MVDIFYATKVFHDWMYIKDSVTAEKVLKENHKDFEIYYGIKK